MVIKTDIEHTKLDTLYGEIKDTLDSIDTIIIEDNELVETSGLLSMIASLHHTHSQISIPKLDDKTANLNGLGKVILKV